MRGIMIMCFGVGAIWDGITTMLGIATILNARTELDYGLCFVGGLVILGFSLSTKTIFSENNLAFIAMRFLWAAAILFDVYTAFTGNTQYVILKTQTFNMALLQTLEMRQMLVLLVMTLLVSGSPIFISFLVDTPKRSY